MNRGIAYEICGLCEAMRPSSEMQDVYVKNPDTGLPVRVRFCRTCLKPRLTYIQWASPAWLTADVGCILTVTLALILVVSNVIFGLVIGTPLGSVIALAAILVGAGILASLAVT